jgi:8-oxo-dGTP pyrophosphatase MutT (NUDIX family)
MTDPPMTDPPMTDPDVVRLSRRVVYANPWLRVTEDTVRHLDGSTGQFGVVHSNDFAVVIPFDGERYHLVEQYRYPVGGRFWEFPQGSIVDAPDAAPETVATAELAEESGLRAETLTHLGRLHYGYGRSSNAFTVFLATGLTTAPTPRDHEEQGMRTGTFTLDEIWQMVDDARITDAQTLAALALLGRARDASRIAQPQPPDDQDGDRFSR